MTKTPQGPLESLHYPRPFEANFIPHILKEMYIDQVYRPYFAGRNDLTILDLGANIGLFTRYAAPFAKKIVAVEPDTNNFAALMLNTSHLPEEQISLVKACVANENGVAKLYHTPNKTAHNMLMQTDDFEEVEQLSVLSILNRAGIEKVDLMKVDIEGAEFEVLCGPTFNSVAKNIKYIMGEMHDWAGRNYNQLLWALRDLGFKARMVNKTEAAVFEAWREE